MRKTIIFLIGFAIPLLCMAQIQIGIEYEYDEAGNRIARKILYMGAAPTQAAQDSTVVELLEPDNLISTDFIEPESAFQSTHLAPNTEFFIDKLDHVEIKIYPNPTTEKITLAIADWSSLKTGIFKLFTLSGQLLQEQPVHSHTTEVSLAGLAHGAYILKVQINGITEDWKIIKN
jgi:hypothetical protein